MSMPIREIYGKFIVRAAPSEKNKPALSVSGKTFDASSRQHESRAAFFRRYDLDHFKLTIPFPLEGLLLRFYDLVGSGILKTGE